MNVNTVAGIIHLFIHEFINSGQNIFWIYAKYSVENSSMKYVLFENIYSFILHIQKYHSKCVLGQENTFLILK